MKELYSYEIELKQTVLKTVIETKKKKNKETGKFDKIEIEVEKEVEEDEDYQFCVKSPNTRVRKEAEIFYSIKLNEYIQKGILTHRQIFNKYMDNGGILSKGEDEESFEALLALSKIKEELEKITAQRSTEAHTEKKKEKERELVIKQRELYDTLYQMELQKDAIFSNSADSMAKNNLIEWWILNLTYYRKGEDGEYKQFFGEGLFDEKYDLLCEMEDGEHELFTKAIPTAANVVTLWTTSGMEKFSDFKEAIEGVPEE
tara:strand:- start:3389 stop:4165 length:777 start_codon:yes stop_codon:yes gene_type:complete